MAISGSQMRSTFNRRARPHALQATAKSRLGASRMACLRAGVAHLTLEFLEEKVQPFAISAHRRRGESSENEGHRIQHVGGPRAPAERATNEGQAQLSCEQVAAGRR